MTKAPSRPYRVDIIPNGDATPHAPRLVRATYAHIAQRHVIGQLVQARVASKDDIMELMGAGVRVEDASEGEPAVDARQGALGLEP